MLFNMTESPLLNDSSLSSDNTNGEAQVGLRWEIIVLSVILSIFCVLGTIGNALAFFIYYRKREKGTSTIFILSLAVTDFFTCLFAIPYSIASELVQYRHVYDIVCKMYLFIQTFNIPLSSLIMVAIGFDRYFCICHPFLHAVTVPRAKVCVVVLTILSALMGVVPMLSHGVYYRDLEVVEINTTLDNNIVSGSSLSLASSISSTFPGTEGLATTTTAASSTELFTNGLFLEPAAEFMNDQLGHGAAINYKTDNTNPPPSTLMPVAASPLTFLDLSSDASNVTENYTTILVNRTVIMYSGRCSPNDLILSQMLVANYLKIYASLYLIEFIVLAILYALIYRSILVRRAWKAKRKRMSCYASTNCPETAAEETQLTNINGAATETVLLKKNAGRISTAMRDRTFYANIKTAAMLFVVTIGFVVSFLPSWMMGLRLLPFNIFVFHMFYINNVINPIIYAFMNRAFRDDLVSLLKSCLRC